MTSVRSRATFVWARLGMAAHVTAARLWMPRDLQSTDARASVALALGETVKSFGGRVPPLDPLEHMAVSDAHLERQIARIETAETAIAALQARAA